MKKIFLIGLFSVLANNVFSQKTGNKIYFLADTINISKENRFLKIETISFFEHHFIFYCKCTPPYKNYVRFVYINKKGVKLSEIVSIKPNYSYVSFKELMDIVALNHIYFDDNYELYITEALPGNKYRTNKVSFVGYSQPIIDSVRLPNKQ